MMPIYFHLASHLWIFYLFFFNGFLIHLLLKNSSSLRSGHYAEMTNTFEASLLAAFFISIVLNGCLLYVLDLTEQNFSLMMGVLPIVTISLILLGFKSNLAKIYHQTKDDYDWLRLLLYLFVFVVLFFNGGLIEQTADSWWHMSLANKIGLANSFILEIGHLTGEPTRYYPPLWHANLALAHVLSGESIPVFWNSFTAWGGALKVMSFYLFALTLSKSRSIAFLSAALFVLLPGMGVSYLRVSAWPSHVSYTAMFCLFCVAFFVLDRYKEINKYGTQLTIYQNLIKLKSAVIAIIFLVVLILFVHQVELLWFFVGMTSYFTFLLLYQFHKINGAIVERKTNLFEAVSATILIICICGCVFAFFDDWQKIKLNIDWLITSFTILCFFVLLSLIFFSQKINIIERKRPVIMFLNLIVMLLMLFSVDLKHLLSLVKPELAYPLATSHELPLMTAGFFGGELKLPGWHLQLRSALLYSGLLSIPLSIVLTILKPSRLTLFVCANAVIAFLFCLSPYLYMWLIEMLNYHSPWRIATLIFHPIIIAFALNTLWGYFVRPSKA